MMAQRSKQEVLDYLSRAEVAAVGTSIMGTPRQRMMHFGADEDFNIYVSSMKGDPKVIRYAQKNYDKTSADLIPSNAHTAIAHLFWYLLFY